MGPDIQIEVIRDTATPALEALKGALSPQEVKRGVGTACTIFIQGHLRSLGPNKMGWPTTHFYDGAARGTSWDFSEDGVTISVDNADAPGAMRQRFHGGPITAKDKLLTIPARQEFYGHAATEFTNLKFVPFRSGAKALVVGSGGVSLVNMRTGRERSVKGAGAKAQGVVAYWLKDQVNQEGDPGVLPESDKLADVAVGAVVSMLEEKGVL